MPSRGRHQSTSKECRRLIEKIEALDSVKGVIIGQSYGGKSLGRHAPTGTIKIQRRESGGFKAVTQTAKGVQELFIRVQPGAETTVADALRALR